MSTKNPFSWMVSRRTFLALSGLGLTGFLAACDGIASANVAPPTSEVKILPLTARPTTQVAPGESDWKALANSLQGTLIRPDNTRYAVAHQLFSTRFDGILPAGVAYCASPADVQACLAFVRRFGLPVTARSGGHSYAGYSTTTGLMLDMTQIAQVTINTSAGTATVGGGAHLIDVYATLAQDGLVLPAGSCPTVGVAGLTLGGGVGVLSRKFGTTSDNLLSAQVVLANGDLLTCDQGTNADLFWALRGGGGGNFGIVTSFTFAVHPVAQLTLFTLDWPWSAAADVVDGWQHWGPSAPDELWSNCLLLGMTGTNGTPIVRVNGVYIGEAGPLNPLLQQLIDGVGSVPSDRYVYTDSLLDAMMAEAGCYGSTVAACHLPSQNSQGTLARDTSSARSDYFTDLLPRSAIEIMVNSIRGRQPSTHLSGGGIGLDAYGGALNRVPAAATAFVHRNALFSAQYTASWNTTDPASVASANANWLNTLWQALRPFASGEAYQNYIDPHLDNWQQAYYGSNLARLRQIKATYDPTNLFHFAQSIASV